eukprot:Gregarina_sp_Poly_1__7415@NODE_410_length_8787_cov_70_764335_g333_i0_p7_GENE_NODE_410_length_8787_cov_70_764335_g333_i0NODE_410_length_8787_cov_70_764335_g333_i0_p7_ORF_typecomplete_len103_score3_60_NODE_410_length_8787_cov_70_764335_g333_i032963604
MSDQYLRGRLHCAPVPSRRQTQCAPHVQFPYPLNQPQKVTHTSVCPSHSSAGTWIFPERLTQISSKQAFEKPNLSGSEIWWARSIKLLITKFIRSLTQSEMY